MKKAALNNLKGPRTEIPSDLLWWMAGHVAGLCKGIMATTELFLKHDLKPVALALMDASYACNKAVNYIRELEESKKGKPRKARPK